MGRTHTVTALAACLCALFVAASAHAAIENGLQAYWQLDGNLTDTTIAGDVGTNHNGTAVGAAAYAAGMFGQGGSFNNSWYVDAANSGTLGTGDMTFSAWITRAAWNTSWQAIAAKGEGNGFRVARNSGDNHLGFNAGPGGDLAAPGQNVDDGLFHHVLITHDDTGGVNNIYVDGVKFTSGGHAGIDGSGTFSLARNPDAGGRQWNGIIDDAAVWNRALTDYEAAQVYYGGLGGNNLAAMINGAGVAAWDVTEVRSNGTINNLLDSDISLQSGTGTVLQGLRGTINMHNSAGGGGSGDFSPSDEFLDTANADDFVVHATARIKVATAGEYTFYAKGDDGFRLSIRGAEFTAVGDTGDGTATINGDTLQNNSLGGNVNGYGVVYLEAGVHEIEYTFFERAGGAYAELSAAAGSKVNAFDSSFQLVGDMDNGGFMLSADQFRTGSKSIQFDVGDNAGSYTGTEAPAHSRGQLGAGDDQWNTVIGDSNGPFVFTDGTSTGPIMVDFGRQNGASTIDWSATATGESNTSGSGVEDTALMEDWLFTNGNNNLGVRIKGLDPGIYDVYALVREPNEQTRLYDVGIGVDTDDTTEITDLVISSIIDGSANNGTAWVEDTNYALQRVTVSSVDDWIVIIVDPTNAAFGTLEGFQIVQLVIPTPSALPAGLALIGLVAARRRRK